MPPPPSNKAIEATKVVPENMIRVEDRVYSAEKLIDLHPGGPLFIKV